MEKIYHHYCYMRFNAQEILKAWKSVYSLQLTLSSPTLVKAVHSTPVKHYKDDLSFKFSASGKACNVEVRLETSSIFKLYNWTFK